MENKLLPCPFCGKTNALKFVNDFELIDNPHAAGYLRIVCSSSYGGCGAAGGFGETEDEAIKAWNRRATNGMD